MSVGTAVDMWARDAAAEAKELAVVVGAKQDAHEKKCDERHSDQMTWQQNTTKEIGGIRKEMWGLALAGLVAVIGAFAIVTWALIQHLAGMAS